jgi:hypothetical protein
VRFDIYGRYELDVVREGAGWQVFKLGEGKRVPLNDLFLPSDLQENEIATYLDDLFHELSRPGETVHRIG